MNFSASQIVGLIEIETSAGAGSECLVPLGREERSLAELLAWLTGPIARPLVGDDAAEVAATPSSANRLAGLVAPGPVLDADLVQLETDLVDAAAQFRLRLTGIATTE
ncbi:MAG TPA: hypothetical protein VHY91_10820 [Pirellulales bacterium]|jgi:hypothetical protein|nr:hypothetical protein [Pirellulales bacterium]